MKPISILLTLSIALSFLACAEPEPWEPTSLTEAVAATGGFDPDLSQVEAELGPFDPQPNLYDLHHPDGALSRAGWVHGLLVMKILDKAGYETEIDEALGEYRLAGEARSLWLHQDKTRLVLPTTLLRFSLPPRAGIISITESGQIRVTNGDYMATPIARSDDLVSFAANWASTFDVPSPRVEAASAREVETLPITIDAAGDMISGSTRAGAADFESTLAIAIAESGVSTVELAPSPSANYDSLVSALEALYRLRQSGTEVRFAIRSGDARRPAAVVEPHSGSLDGPVIVLKADVATPWREISGALDNLRGILPEVVLLTHLDLSNPDAIDENTLLGGLPGGLPLSLTPVRDGDSPLVAADARRPSANRDSSNPVGRDVDDFGVPLPEPAFEEPDQPIHVGGDVQAPVLLSGPEAEYTEIARKARIQGVVICQVVINTEGEVENVKVLKGLPMGLSEKAVEAFRQYQYEPATLQGQPVAVYYNVTMNFRLQ